MDVIFYIVIFGLLGLLNAALAKRLGLSPILGFVIGFLSSLICPGVSTTWLIIALANAKRNV